LRLAHPLAHRMRPESVLRAYAPAPRLFAPLTHLCALKGILG